MTELRFHNTLGRKLERFEPLEPGRVGIYTCGPTVYNNAHIGNFRTFIFEDLLRRTLRYFGYEVTQVMNITDVDDKIIGRVREDQITIAEATGPFIDSFFEDLDLLHIERAEEYPRATEHIPEMVELVESLVAKEHAYESEGSIFFRIASDPDYGRLSGHDLSQARRGERVADDEYDKEDVKDFVLWKGTKPGEPSWESPYGEGRPGWHLECSAMSMKYLGTSFDIHCGGIDNIFPHHENEIAQSESATGHPFARYWIHAEHLIVDGHKMSKSLGNQYTLPDLVERGADPRAIRYLFLSVHYRQKLNFTFDALDAAAGALRRVDEFRFRLENSPEGENEDSAVAERIEQASAEFRATLGDDLNASGALGVFHKLITDLNISIDRGELACGDRDRIVGALDEFDTVLGVLDRSQWQSEEAGSPDLSHEEIDRLVQERQEARTARDFAAADRIRDELLEAGIVIEDTPQGPRWKAR